MTKKSLLVAASVVAVMALATPVLAQSVIPIVEGNGNVWSWFASLFGGG